MTTSALAAPCVQARCLRRRRTAGHISPDVLLAYAVPLELHRCTHSSAILQLYACKTGTRRAAEPMVLAHSWLPYDLLKFCRPHLYAQHLQRLKIGAACYSSSSSSSSPSRGFMQFSAYSRPEILFRRGSMCTGPPASRCCTPEHRLQWAC